MLQVLAQECYFTSKQAGQMVAAFSYGEDKVDAAVKVSQTACYIAVLLASDIQT